MKIDDFFVNLGEGLKSLFGAKRAKSGAKEEFLNKLRKELSPLSQAEIKEHLAFYSEMIDDRMEEGLSEEEAVAAVGSAEDIAAQIFANNPDYKREKEKTKREKDLQGWQIALIILGSPIWFSLLIACTAVVFSLWVAMWAVVISLWAVAVALVVCGPALVIAAALWPGVIMPVRLAVVGAGLICAGIAIIMVLCCVAVTKGCALLTKSMAGAIMTIFGRRDR